MSRPEVEKLLLESIRGFLAQKAKLGLASHDKEETSHTQWFEWEDIDDMFALKASGSPFFESLTAAFNSVHSYKHIDHPTFSVTLDNELRSQGIPADDRAKAVKYIEEIVEEFTKGKDAWAQRDAGWSPNIEELGDMTRNADERDAPTSKPFTGGGPAPQKNELQNS